MNNYKYTLIPMEELNPTQSLPINDAIESLEVSEKWFSGDKTKKDDLISLFSPAYILKGVKANMVDGSKQDLLFKSERAYSPGIIKSSSGDYLVVQIYDRTLRQEPTENQTELISNLTKFISVLKHHYQTEHSEISDTEAFNSIYYLPKYEMMKRFITEEQASREIDLYRDNSSSNYWTNKIHRFFKPNGILPERKDQSKVNDILLFNRQEHNSSVTSPVLFLRLKKDKHQKITTPFYSEDDDSKIDPIQFINKPCYVTCAFKINGILIRQTVSGLCHVKKLDLTLEECVIKEIDRKIVPKTSLINEHLKNKQNNQVEVI